MTGAAPTGAPVFFVDRSLGRRGRPNGLRAAGISLVTLAEVYGVPADETVADVTWLERAGHEGWPVLMKDQRIRHRPAERGALVRYGVTAFCLANGNLRTDEMVRTYLAAWPAIVRACALPGPALHSVSTGGLRRIPL